MTAILKPPLSVEQYLQFELTAERRHEYVDGILYQMPGESKNANSIANNFVMFAGPTLLRSKLKTYTNDVKVRTDETKFRYPDIMVAPYDKDGHTHVEEHPVLLGEVLSGGSVRTDTLVKLEEYSKIDGLLYYLVIEQDRPFVLVHRITNRGTETTSVKGTNGVLVLPELKLQLTLSDLYLMIPFEDSEKTT